MPEGLKGNPNRAAVWAGANVYIGKEDAEVPKDSDDKLDGSPFNDDWDVVGVLDGGDGFSETMSFDTNDFYGWGWGIIATVRKNFKYTKQFTALEENETVMGLIWPGNDLEWSGDDDQNFAGVLKVPDLENKFKIAFETRSGKKGRRLVSYNYAQIDEIGDSTESDEELQKRQLTVVVYPDNKQRLFHSFKGEMEGDGDDSDGGDGSGE